MPTLLEVWETRLGISEIAGSKHNKIILQWAESVGWGSIKDDETPWCSISMCSAAQEAGLPLPPHAQRPMARSWLTWGTPVNPASVKPGDVVIWPRGKSDWQGHVNCVAEVKKLKTTVKVRCIGGNQSLKGTNGAVTKTDWVDIKGALPNGVRRAVEPTATALAAAGSTEIKSANNMETALLATGGVTSAVKIADGTGAIDQLKNVSDNAGVVQHAMEALHAVAKFAVANLWVVAVVGCIALYIVNRQRIKARIAKHMAGIPIFGGK